MGELAFVPREPAPVDVSEAPAQVKRHRRAVNVVLNVALNAAGGYFAAKDMRYGPLGPRPR